MAEQADTGGAGPMPPWAGGAIAPTGGEAANGFSWSTVGDAVFNLTDGGGNQQAFTVQPEMLPQLMTGLDEVRDHYKAAQDQAEELALVLPPFGDDTTVAVTKKIAERADGGEGSLYDTAQGMIEWVDGFKAAVQAAIEEHRRIDDENMKMGIQ